MISRVLNFLHRIVRLFWAFVLDTWTGLRPMRFGLLVVFLEMLLLTESGTEQGRDALVEYANGLAGWSDIFQGVLGWLFFLTAVFGALVWGVSRIATRVIFKNEEPVLLQFRTTYPEPACTQDDPHALIQRMARLRVDWIKAVRLWGPRYLGALAPLVVGLSAVDAHEPGNGLALLGGVLAVGIGLPVIGFFWSRRSQAPAPTPAKFDAGLAGLVLGVAGALVILIAALFLMKLPSGVNWILGYNVLIAVVLVSIFVSRRSLQSSLDRVFRRIRSKVVNQVLNSGPVKSRFLGLSNRALWLLVGAIFVAIALLVIGGINPLVSQSFGPIPVLQLALVVVLIVGTLLASASRVSHLPVFTVIAVAVFWYHAQTGDHHMRFVDGPSGLSDPGASYNSGAAVKRRKTPQQAIDQFAARINGDQGTRRGERPGERPVFFVATAGGGSRAAYWTVAVLSKLNKESQGRFGEHLFAMSGVSGGALGATLFKAGLEAVQRDGTIPPAKLGAILKQASGGDFLSPGLIAMFTRDMFPTDRDRAYWIETAWRESFRKACETRGGAKSKGVSAASCPVDLEKGFLDLWADNGAWPGGGRATPALLLNGTIVETGGRIVVGNLQIGCPERLGGAVCQSSFVNAADLLAINGRDLVAGSAINNAARFPIVEPSGTVLIGTKWKEKDKKTGGCEEGYLPAGDRCSRHVAGRVVDGGYFENFGATTLAELLLGLQRRLETLDLRPVIVQITSDADIQEVSDDFRGRARLGDKEAGGHQLLDVSQASFATRGAHGVGARMGLKRLADLMRWEYFHLRLCRSKDGGQPAPLAWFLSDQSKSRMDRQLMRNDPGCKNKKSIEDIVGLLPPPEPGTP